MKAVLLQFSETHLRHPCPTEIHRSVHRLLENCNHIRYMIVTAYINANADFV